jgi:hypothetical protein
MFGCLVWVGQTGFVEATLASLYSWRRCIRGAVTRVRLLVTGVSSRKDWLIM